MVVSVFAWLGCKPEHSAPEVPLDIAPSCEEGQALECRGERAVTCLDGGVEHTQDCADAGLTCDPAYGCVACAPSRYTCHENTVYLCSSDGSHESLVEKCGSGTQCSPDGCVDLCAQAEKERSYLGCDYWPTFTSNSQLDALFRPAVVVANPNLVPASVRIDKDGRMAASVTVPAESASTVVLEFDADLKGTYEGPDGSTLSPGAAYHLTSSVPVTVHQFNPLLYELDQDCVSQPENDQKDGRCNSYTNDASLLLPSHVLARGVDEGVSYLGVSRATFLAEFSATHERKSYAGFLALTAAGDRMVKVKVKSSAYTVGSADGKVPALAPGDELEAELMPGDVLQIRAGTPPDCPGASAVLNQGKPNELAVCDPGSAYDLTGTAIESDGALQVIGGHDCTYVPYDRPACDHLEESLFPLETWGQEVVVTRPRAKQSTVYRLRVVSGADQNTIRFEPAKVHAQVTLDRGKFLEFETDQHVIVRGQKQLAVAQYLVGQGGSADGGDPSLSLAIPSDQFRESYTFISPETYDSNYVNVIAPAGSDVLLDGQLIDGFEPVGDGTLEAAPVFLDRPGQHELRGADGQSIGLVLYGYGAYTSYMLPGGLDLRIIGVPL